MGYPRKMIVGRAMIVGQRGGGGGYNELEQYATGAAMPPPPAPPLPPGHPHAPIMHPAHPAHPGHQHYRAWYHDQGGYGGQAWGRRHHPLGAPQAYVRAPMGPVVPDEQPTHTREFPIGFAAVGAFAVGAGLQAEIDQKPQVLYRGERLAVPASLVGNFDFNDLKVGKDTQLAAAGIMPTE